jgi:spore maturation protein CgeB
LKIVIFGLSITSAWGNGHATTFRSLVGSLHARGHEVVFFEKDLEWYASNRDLPDPPFCEMLVFQNWDTILSRARRELKDCDVAMVGSYFPDGIRAIDEVLESPAPVKAFYDIDTPVTVAQLRDSGATDYLQGRQIPGFDLYLSFTGGPMLRELEKDFGAQRAVPLYCSVDAEEYRAWPVHKRYQSDMSYMGTYAPDRQPKIEELFCAPARQLPRHRFLLAGPQYPRELRWPANVRRIRAQGHGAGRLLAFSAAVRSGGLWRHHGFRQLARTGLVLCARKRNPGPCRCRRCSQLPGGDGRSRVAAHWPPRPGTRAG